MNHFKSLAFITFISFALFSGALDAAERNKFTIQLTVPGLKVAPYHRPFVAVWLESEKRKGIRTIAVWYDQDDWLKDMRQWWRKLGRKGKQNYDIVTSATKKPGSYQISGELVDSSNKPLDAGYYYLNFEASREEGGRDFIRKKIFFDGSSQSFTLSGEYELGSIEIKIN